MKILLAAQYVKWEKNLKDPKARAKIAVRVARILSGNLGDSKSLGSGFYELRVDHGPGYRFYFGKKGNEIIILIAGSTKKGQQKAIEDAKKIWKEIK